MTAANVPIRPNLTTEPPLRHRELPALAWAAWHGPAAKYVRTIAPGTEADPLAVYLMLLSALGTRMDDIHVRVGEDRHRPLIWLLIVGATATGRKGTAEQLAIDPLFGLSSLNSLYSPPRRGSGLNSGEGLIEAFAPTDDGAIPDPRLLIVEPEWDSVLSITRRDGNSLPGHLRNAWDGRPLVKLTVSQPRNIEEHHLTVVGHITPDALRVGMGNKEASNGFLNRFLLAEVRRPQLVPFPSKISPIAHALIADLTKAADTAPRGEWFLTDPARDLYVDWYNQTERTREGFSERVAQATARASGHLMRIALTLAVIDCQGGALIDVPHIRAAAAVVDYSLKCAETLYGPGAAGTDGRILTALRIGPHTMDDLYRAMSGHLTAAELRLALSALVDAGLVVIDKEPTGGRPRQVVSLTPRR